ncbi:MAG TPA: DNA recombination protein RmuC [Candidatus Xenobia bacterium]|nr:DNA recombination protein RmuC [Candidatus Xenobia bacterium]
MSVETILVAVIVAVAAGVVGYLLARRSATASPPPVVSAALPPEIATALKDLGALKSQVELIAQTQATTQQVVGSLQTRLAESAGSVKSDLLQALHQTQQSLETLRADYTARKAQEENLHRAVKGIEAVIAGGSARGGAGESVLAEAFQQFPPDMLETDFKVGGKPVEYAVVLPNDRRLPIDSKWAGSELLEELAQATDSETRRKLTDRIEEAALKKAAEVQKYLDPRFTVNVGVAAVPDAVFSCCRTAHIRAFRDYRVLLMPYSLAVPYVLALYNLYLQHGRSVELENLNNFLSQVEAQMALLDDIVQNRVAKIHAMAGSSRDDLLSVLASVRTSLQQLRALPEPAVKSLPGEGSR